MTPLRLSRQKPYEDQQVFFRDSHRIDSPAATRVIVGSFFEHLSREMFSATPHITDSTADICPDLRLANGTFLEIKSIGLSRQGIVYADRLKRDARLSRQTGNPLYYVFWVHSVPATQFTRREDLQEALRKGVDRVLVIDGARLRSACRKLTPTRMLVHRGDGGKVGYRLPWKLLTDLAKGPTVVRVPARGGTPAIEMHGEVGGVFPMTASEQSAAGDMLHEMTEAPLVVTLVPAPSPKHSQHMVRSAQSRNPKWYQKLCEQYPSPRKKARNRRVFDTDIRRALVLGSLERLWDGKCLYPYDWMLRPLLQARAARSPEAPF
jgi:hypothetical protein